MPLGRLSRLALVGAALLLAGCLGTPRLQPRVLGVGELTHPLQSTPGTGALGLPMLPANCAPEPDCPGGRPRPTYRLGPLDEIAVQVWGRPDLGSQIPSAEGRVPTSQVSAKGTISLPFVGALPVAGQSTEAVASLVEQKYAEILDRPQVTVRLMSCRSKSVLVEGGVARPGLYYLCDDRATIGEILAASGGITKDADPTRATLVRQGAPFVLDWWGAERGETRIADVLLEDGDQLHFPGSSEHLVYVFGEVTRQSVLPIPAEGLDLLGALGQVGGMDVITAQTRRFFLVRGQLEAPAVYQLSLEEVLQSPRIALMDGDRIFVPPTSLAKWNRWWRQVLPLSVYGPATRVALN